MHAIQKRNEQKLNFFEKVVVLDMERMSFLSTKKKTSNNISSQKLASKRFSKFGMGHQPMISNTKPTQDPVGLDWVAMGFRPARGGSNPDPAKLGFGLTQNGDPKQSLGLGFGSTSK